MKTRVSVHLVFDIGQRLSDAQPQRPVRRARHLSTEHKDAISRGLCKRNDKTLPGRCHAGQPDCTCHYCLRAKAIAANAVSAAPASANAILDKAWWAKQPVKFIKAACVAMNDGYKVAVARDTLAKVCAEHGIELRVER